MNHYEIANELRNDFESLVRNYDMGLISAPEFVQFAYLRAKFNYEELTPIKNEWCIRYKETDAIRCRYLHSIDEAFSRMKNYFDKEQLKIEQF